MKTIALFALTLAVLSAFSLTACNTVEGAGRDVERAGEAVQDAAD
jgi:predicted small secreted protein